MSEPRPTPPDTGRQQLAEQLAAVVDQLPSRVEIDPDTVQQDLGRLVLTLVELLRRVVEHQALQRMDDADLDDAQVERMGVALLQLEEKMKEMKDLFGLADEELNLDLGPLGKLL